MTSSAPQIVVEQKASSRGTTDEVGRQAVFGLEPKTVVLDETDVADRALADVGGKLADLVVGGVRRRVEDVERAKRGDPFRLVRRHWE